MHLKTKKTVILLLDVGIGILIEIWASKMFPDHGTLLVSIFVILLSVRVVYDWFFESEEELWYNLEMEKYERIMQGNVRIQTAIANKMVDAINRGDYSEIKKLQDLKTRH